MPAMINHCAAKRKSSSLRTVSNHKTTVRSLLVWFAKHARDLPWRGTLDPYAIWISEIMLQQTQVKTVIPFWNRWMIRFPNVNALSRAKTETLLRFWAGLGYYSRAQNLKLAAQRILDVHQGVFPSDFDDMLKLPGVGRYTAGAISSIAFDQPKPVVDGNVIRVLSRVLGIQTNPRQSAAKENIWRVARELVETASQLNRMGTRNCSHLNQSLMELGAILCIPRDPKCPQCPLRTRCAAHHLGRTREIPALAPRPKPKSRVFAAFAVSHKGNYLVRKRSETGINAQLWEFPNSEYSEPAETIESVAKQCLGFSSPKRESIGTILHTITRNRILLRVFYSKKKYRAHKTNGSEKWCSLQQLQKLPFPSAHRKIIKLLMDNQTLKPRPQRASSKRNISG